MENVSSTLRDSYAGEGITNGNSITNGNGIEDSNQILTNKKKTYNHNNKSLIAVSIFIFLLFIFTSIFIFTEGRHNKDIIIDGKFNDWNKIINYKDSTFDQVKNNNINIIKYGINNDKVSLSFYLEVFGRVLSGTNTTMDTIQIFIDVDKSKQTGYLFEDKEIGADFMILISGRNNNIESAIFYQFDNKRTNNDWNSWKSMFPVEAICLESEIEIKLWLEDFGSDKNNKILVYFHTFDGNDNHDFSDYLISNEKGALGVEVKSDLKEILEPGKSYEVLKLDMKAQVSDITINSITLERIGTATDSDLVSVTLISNKERTSNVFKDGKITLITSLHLPLSSEEEGHTSVLIEVDIATTAESAHTIGFKVVSIDLFPGVASINHDDMELSYIKNASDEIIIDGAFGDWENLKSNYDKKGDVTNPNVDIVDFNSVKQNEKASFYLKVDGKMMAGVSVPARTRSISIPAIKPKESIKQKIEVGSQEKHPLPIVTGEDTVYIFLDTDKKKETGFPILNDIIGADYMIKIKGQYGILISEYFEYNSSILKEETNNKWDNWKRIDDIKVEAACSAKQLECQIDLLNTRIISSIDVYFHIVDWKGEEDYSDDILNKVSKNLISAARTKTIYLKVRVSPFECEPEETVEYYFNLKDTKKDNYGLIQVKIYAPANFTVKGAIAPLGGDGDGGSWSVTYTSSHAIFIYNNTSGDNRSERESGFSGFKVKAKAPDEIGSYIWQVSSEDSNDEKGCEQFQTDVIPEFNNSLIPIFGVIALFVIFKSKGGWNNDESQKTLRE